MVRPTESLPIGKTAQRALERHWATAMSRGVLPSGVRSLVRDSWARAIRTSVSPTLPKAPLVLDDNALAEAQHDCEWLPFARSAANGSSAPYADGGHILTLFDGSGRMLWSEGDPRALDGLSGINFRPGAIWAEDYVGTNGPGTALATGAPVHIVGAEHYCEQWHAWHCAAMPVRDPLTGEICGIVDISGFRDAAHPHTLTLTSTLVVAIEQMLRAREAERRILVMQRLTELAGRWPGDAAVAIDRSGTVIGALHEGAQGRYRIALVQEAMRQAVASAAHRDERGRHIEQTVTLGDGSAAILYPVVMDAVPVGACLIVPKTERRPAGSARRTAAGSTRYTLSDLVGDSAALNEAIDLATSAAATELPVLLEGESGTGKELFAQGIHAAGRRAGGPFIAVNCAALPRELVESELFGYIGGAFSGARREGQNGKFEAANGGTIFLDEVAELPATAQAALLRVLQEGEITPVGSAHSRRVDVRVIAATNRDLAATVNEGAFRTDLYYRLNVLGITLPPLRERPDDIEELAQRFLMEAAADLGRSAPRLTPAQVTALRLRSWPGNVRELKNLMRRVVALGAGVLQAESTPITRSPSASPPPRTGAPPDAQREALIAAVRSARTMGEAAARLGVTRSTLYRRMGALGLRPERFLADRD
jgi:transcriptional regulator of acetoin/glycerol metabolism